MSRILSTCYIISIVNEIISIKSKAVSLALRLLQAALRWQTSLDIPMRSWSDLLLDTTVLQGSTGRWKVSHTHSSDCKLKDIPRTRRDCNHRKWEPGTKIISWDTDAASGFAYSNTGINLPKCFPLFPSNFAAVQIQFSPCVRNDSPHVCAFGFLSGLYSHSPQGCPNTSEFDILISSHGSFLQLHHVKGAQLHNDLTCSITFLAAVLPHSLGKKNSPGARSQEKIAKLSCFSKNLLLRGTEDMRNIIVGLEENIRKNIIVLL